MNIEIDPQAYKDDGFVLLKNFFDPGEIDMVREEAKRIFLLLMREHGIVSSLDVGQREFDQGMFRLFERDIQGFTNCGKQAQHLISLHRLSLDERIVRVLKDLGLEFPNISTRPLLYFNSERLAKKEVYWRLRMHQDWRSMQGSLDSIVVWVPLVDVGINLGALEIIPGSHRWGLLDAELQDGYANIEGKTGDTQAVPVEVEKGDALFFSSLLAHQSGINSTETIRWSCHFRYNNLADPTFVGRGFPHPYIYKPQEELITADFPTPEAVRQLFG